VILSSPKIVKTIFWDRTIVPRNRQNYRSAI